MLQFVRQRPVQIVIQGALSQRRGFLFQLQAGFSRPVDELSGMSVDLVKVDQWITQIKRDLQAQMFYSATADNFNETLAEILQAARADLAELAAEEQVHLASLTLAEERGVELHWESFTDLLIFKTKHYIEDFSSGAFQLLQVGLSWHLPEEGRCVDLSHKAFSLLRAMEEIPGGSVIEKLHGAVRQNDFAFENLRRADLCHLALKQTVSLEQVDFQSEL